MPTPLRRLIDKISNLTSRSGARQVAAVAPDGNQRSANANQENPYGTWQPRKDAPAQQQDATYANVPKIETQYANIPKMETEYANIPKVADQVAPAQNRREPASTQPKRQAESPVNAAPRLKRDHGYIPKPMSENAVPLLKTDHGFLPKQRSENAVPAVPKDAVRGNFRQRGVLAENSLAANPQNTAAHAAMRHEIAAKLKPHHA